MASDSVKHSYNNVRNQEVEKGSMKKNVPIRLVNEASSSEEDEKAGTVTIKLDDKSDVELTKFGGGNTEQTVQFILKLHQLFEQNGTTKKMNAANKALDDLLEELDWKLENPPSSTEEDIQTDDSDDEGNPRARITRKVKYDRKVDKLNESIKWQKEKEQVLVLKCLNLVNKLMDSEQSTLFKRLTKEVTNKMDWVDDDGVVHPEKRGLSKKSLELILLEYVLHVCPTDGAEVVREYLQHKIKLGPVSIKALYNRVLQINSYIQYLPCLKDSSFATKDTPRMNVPFNKYELCQVIMRALPERWQTQYDMTHKVIASDPNALREELEKIERNEAIKRKESDGKQSARDKKKAKSSPKPTKSGQDNKVGPDECALCKKYKGPYKSHATKDCTKFDSNGNRLSKKPKYGGGGGGGASKANYAQLQKRCDDMEKKLKKAMKKRKASRKEKRRRKVYEDSSSSDSDSDE